MAIKIDTENETIVSEQHNIAESENINVTDQITRDDELQANETIWVDIREVIPNPMNPRTDDNIQQDEMKEIIRTRGWEEPLTAYKQGKIYVLLAGHRRLAAARSAKETRIPLFVVEKPATEQEEIERIASLQSGRVDWSVYDWAKFTYERWIAWKKPPVSRFAKELNLGVGKVKQYINVFDNFPRHEIELQLQQKSLTISSLDALAKWIKHLKTHQPDLVAQMGEDLIRKIMMEKIITNKINRDELRNLDYPKQAKPEEIQDFLADKNMKLGNTVGYLGLKKKYQDFNGQLISMGLFKKKISEEIKPETAHQKEQAVKALEEMKAQIEEKLKEFKG